MKTQRVRNLVLTALGLAAFPLFGFSAPVGSALHFDYSQDAFAHAGQIQPNDFVRAQDELGLAELLVRYDFLRMQYDVGLADFLAHSVNVLAAGQYGWFVGGSIDPWSDGCTADKSGSCGGGTAADPAPIPEPSNYAMLAGLGALVLASCWRLRRRQTACRFA
ncbi:MAG: hypothetical protein ABSE59_09375 [Opitutaceae bacterium]